MKGRARTSEHIAVCLFQEAESDPSLLPEPAFASDSAGEPCVSEGPSSSPGTQQGWCLGQLSPLCQNTVGPLALTTNVFLTALKAGKSKVKVPAGSILGEETLPCRWLPSHVLTSPLCVCARMHV